MKNMTHQLPPQKQMPQLTRYTNQGKMWMKKSTHLKLKKEKKIDTVDKTYK